MDTEKIEKLISDFIRTSPENSLKMKSSNEPAWEEAVVGYCSGADMIFERYKESVGDFHFTPAEIFNLTFPDDPASPEELTVISWILPQRKVTRDDNREQTFYPSERWVMARFPGEDFNVLLRKHLVENFSTLGIQAVAPILSPEWKIEASPKYGLASRWSERHAAHAAGLGTFGLCDGLITSKGKAHRTGSVVARIRIPSTPRPYDTHQEYCLFFLDGSCMTCAKRCPVNAISERGHDKNACFNHAAGTCRQWVKMHYGFDGYGCGLCQTAVPCESGIPEKVLKVKNYPK
jgi:epoxyqueuosine reductase